MYYAWPDESAYKKLRDKKSAIWSLKDMFHILTGKYDDFIPDWINVY